MTRVSIVSRPAGYYLQKMFSLFRYIGYETQKVNYVGVKTINVMLKEDSRILSEVVVTALNISRDKKALGYATQNLDSKDLNDARSNNWISALSGKVAGLNLVSAGSGPLYSVRVSLRGDNSLNPNGNNALIVLDGVPVNSGMTGNGVSNAYSAGSGNDVPVDFGNGFPGNEPTRRFSDSLYEQKSSSLIIS